MSLGRGRALAESLMLDTGQALHPTGGMVYDPETQTEVEATSPLFTSPCKIKPPTTVAPRDAEVGGRTAAIVPAELHIPADPAHPEYAELAVGDIWEMASVHPQSLSRVGRRYRITGQADGSFVTACRYTVERVVS